MRSKYRAPLLLLLLFPMGIPTAWSASTKDEVIALKEEVASLKEGQAAIQKDLAEIRKLLEADARPAPSAPERPQFEERDISIAGGHVIGDSAAPLTLVEYTDYQCPFCRRHYQNTHPELVSNYVDTGKVKIVMREFPLTSIHPRALPASIAALCAGDQGKYWEMHDILFQNQKSLADEDLQGYGTTLGLDMKSYTACLEDPAQSDRVEAHMNEAREFGVRGTPSFVLGHTSADDPNQVRIVKFFSGARSFDSIAKEIDELLAGEEPADSAP